MRPPLPSSFSLDDATQSLTAGRAAKPPRRNQMRTWEMLFAPGTIAAKKSGLRRWALALAWLDIGCTLGIGCRLEAVLYFLGSPAFTAPGPIPPVLGLAFLSTVDGLTIALAGSSSPPAFGFERALRAAVSRLGTCRTERFLAALEQAQPLPRLTCPLTGSRLAAFLMWAQGRCKLPMAKPRMRSLRLRSEAPYLPTPTTYPNYDHSGWIPSHEAGCQSTANHR